MALIRIQGLRWKKSSESSAFDYNCICSSINFCKGKHVLVSFNTCLFKEAEQWLNYTLKAFIKIYCLSKYQFSSLYLIIQQYLPGQEYNCIYWKNSWLCYVSRKINSFLWNLAGILKTVLFPIYVLISKFSFGNLTK